MDTHRGMTGTHHRSLGTQNNVPSGGGRGVPGSLGEADLEQVVVTLTGTVLYDKGAYSGGDRIDGKA